MEAVKFLNMFEILAPQLKESNSVLTYPEALRTASAMYKTRAAHSVV